MRISTQYKATLIVFSIVLTIIGASIAFTSQQVSNTRTQESLANSIVQGASDLSYLSSDYVIYHGSQQLTQWQVRYDSFSADVSELKPNTPEQQALVSDIIVNQQRMKTTFDSIVASQDPNVTISDLETSWSRITIQTQTLISRGTNLAQDLRSQVDAQNIQNYLLIGSAIAAFAVFVIVISYQTFRRTLKSISRLEAGTTAISSGNLDTKIIEERDDEIGHLARTFNQMTANLKTTTASKTELEMEIEERKKAELALKELNEELEERVRKRSEQVSTERQRLYNVLETLPVYVILLDKDYHIPFANKVFRDIFGESHGRPCYEFLFERNSPCENCETYKALKSNRPHRWEWTGPNGRDYDIYDFPFIESDGSTLILEMGIDITEQKWAEKQLRDASLYSRSLIEASLDPLVTINADGKITDVNKATEQATGCSIQELIGSDFADYFTEPEEARKGYQKVFADGFVTDYPLAIRHKSGKITYVLYNASLYKDESGEVKGIFAAARDITQRKQAEEKEQESARKLKDSERLAAIGATAGMVGHDIRNPLQAIVGDVFFAKQELKDIPQNDSTKNTLESLDSIEENVFYINKIVADLQDYAKPLYPSAHETNLKTIIEQIIAKSRIPDNVEVSIRFEDEAQKMTADPDYLKRIVGNLVLNAVQAMPQGGKLTIHSQMDKKTGEVSLSFKDTGVGIPENAKAKLFTPMFTTKAKGQGFGLAVVKRMTEALGGTVTFESQEGRGTTFTVRLPTQR